MSKIITEADLRDKIKQQLSKDQETESTVHEIVKLAYRFRNSGFVLGLQKFKESFDDLKNPYE